MNKDDRKGEFTMNNNDNKELTLSDLVAHTLRCRPTEVVPNPKVEKKHQVVRKKMFMKNELLFMRHVTNYAWGVINYYFFVDTDGNTYIHNTTNETGELEKITSIEELNSRISNLPVLLESVTAVKDMEEVKEELSKLTITESNYLPSSYTHTGIVAIDAGSDKLYLVDKNVVTKPLLLSQSGDWNIINDDEQLLTLIPRLKGLFEIPF